MAYEPEDPIKFFRRLGRKGVIEALTRGEIKGDLIPPARDWVVFSTMVAGWWIKGGFVVTVAALVLALFAYVHPPHV